MHGQNPSDCGNLNQEVRLRKSSHTQPCPGSGERQGWRGGKGHDVHTGMTHNIVARQESLVTSVSGICINGHRGWLTGRAFSTLPRLPKGTKNHHCTTRIMVKASFTCASLFLGGEYPKGIWRKAIFCFCKNKYKTSSSALAAAWIASDLVRAALLAALIASETLAVKAAESASTCACMASETLTAGTVAAGLRQASLADQDPDLEAPAQGTGHQRDGPISLRSVAIS